MDNTYRRLAIAKYNHLYKRKDGECCYYCGDGIECYDHFPAIMNLLKYSTENYSKFLLVPSCNECNLLLRDHDSENLTKRRIYLKYELNRKYRKLLNCYWDEEELEDFDYRLKQYIEGQMNAREYIEERLSYPKRNPFWWTAL